ncbi:hypothetical protein ACH5RR_018425 [Cinchona calisaya]|uniref:RING-type domain-containing protein n=1 Tax=Cinchona calisaya TaxID=153742 RepID=A0ABD2ZLI3_9GENT
MASSQVEIASSSPFGYVLKDRNRHDHLYRTRETNAFQKNFKDLVQTHLNSCISGHSRNSDSGSNGKLNHQIDYTDLWVHNPQNPTNETNHHSRNVDDRRISGHCDSNENSPHHQIDLWVHNPQKHGNENNTKKSRAGEKWDKARGMVLAFERKCQDVGSSSGPVSTSQRGMSNEVVSSCPIPLHQRGKSQEGITSGHDLRSQRENSPVQSESSVEVQSLGGVSSLVRKWRDFEAESRCLSAANSPICSSRSNSGLLFADNSSFVDASLRGSDACEEFVDLRPATPAKSEDLFLDWESDQTALSGPPSSWGRDSDVAENERIRVADIIRKLSSNGEDHHNDIVNHVSLPRVRTSLDKSEQRIFSPVCSSPRIRGRQAFTDLLFQMERDRHRELERLIDSKAVSRFSHRGRIQAMLRVRFLRPGAEGKDGQHYTSTSSDSNRLTPSAIVHIRERFNAGGQHCGTDLRCQQREAEDKISERGKFPMTYQERKENHQQEVTEPTKSSKAVVDTNVDAEKPIRANPVVGTNHQESSIMVHQNALQVQRSGIFHQEAISSSDVIQQRATSESSNQGKPEFISTDTLMQMNEGNKSSALEESNIQNIAKTSNGLMDVMSKAQGDWEEDEGTHHHLVVSDCSQESGVSQQLSGWEELLDDYQEQLEMNQDWISDVSRPRSTWEDLRQARYQEMLDPFMENEDIRQLLKRRSVSNFLSSGLRESIDQLMMSRIQSQPKQLANRREEEYKPHQVEEEILKKVEMQEEEQKEPEERMEEQEESVDHNNDLEEDEADNIQIQQDYNEPQDYLEETTSWDHNRDDEVNDNYFDPSAFPSPQQSLSSSSSSPETQPSTFVTNPPSIEMEFIYELKGNMEQLHQEISELRRSVKSCINMQMKLQESLTKDVKTASCHSGRKKRKDSSLSKKSSRGRCCICYEMQIDSLLYRCGHMCTCFKCASNLQWGSGKCPICQAPIIDVDKLLPQFFT